MSAEIITSAELDDYVSDLGIDMAADDLVEAIAAATDAIRQAALNDYTAESFEALTAATAPPKLKSEALALAAGIGTQGYGSRPDSVTTAHEAAYSWLGILAHGGTHFDHTPDSPLEKRGSDGLRVSYTRRTTRKFQRSGDATIRDLDHFDPSIG